MNVLFLCTGNSCRSQMAEGYLRALKGDKFKSYSAGIKVHGLNELAVRVMLEDNVDISHQKSQHIDELKSINFDLVVTVCDHAHENCPYFPGKKIIHKGFDDPPTITKDYDNLDEKLAVYMRVRDQIKNFIEDIESYV